MTNSPGSRSIGRPSDADVTRRILETTVSLVAEAGYAELRLEHVAKRAGCGKTAIYRRYADKAELVAAAAMSVLEMGGLPDTGSLAADLLEHALVNRATQRQAGIAPGGGKGTLAIFEPAVFAKLWDQFFRARRDLGVAIIERGVARGEITADADPEVILDTIAGLTLYRQTVKQLEIPPEHYQAVIAALIAAPPRRR